MATTIITKFGSGAPTASDVVRGELAVDTENKRLYTENSGGSVVELGTNPAANITFGDNIKAIFGAGSDLQIYHDGSHSYIKDAGTGNLNIQANQLRIQSDTGENFIECVPNAQVVLRYDNDVKLQTTSSGIDVTGTVVSDGLTVQTAGVNYIKADQSLGSLMIQTNGANNRAFFSHNGDVSFYEDTGTTAKFFWDSSAESLGIGNTSPATALDVTGTITSDGLSIAGTGITGMNIEAGASSVAYIDFGDSGDTNIGGINYNNADDTLNLRAGNTNRVTVDSSGNVGIGTSTPSQKLSVVGSIASTGVATPEFELVPTGSVGNADIRFDGTTLDIRSNSSSASLLLSTASTERVRIDVFGNVGIGESSPDGLLHLKGDTNANGAELYLQVNNNNTTDNLGAIHFGNNVDSTLSQILSGTSGANNSSYLTFSTSNAGTQSEAMRIDSSGNLLVGTTTSPAAGTAKSVRYGQGVQAGTLSTTTNLTSGTAATVVDMDDAMASNTVGPGMYMVTVVRDGGSYGTHFVGVFGANNTGTTTLYATINAQSMTASVSGSQIQMDAGVTDTYVTNVIPLSIDG